jgi:beta-galactosidase
VIGWQIDNEPGHEGSDLDYSENSLKQFRKWLKDKYKSIKNLNDAWGNVFWGTLYSNFDEIPLPGEHIASGFNPSMIQDFYRFNSDMLVLFIQFQANLLRKFTQNQFITTNLFPSPFLAVTDMEAIAKTLDFVSWDNYPVWGHQTEPFPHQFIAGTHQFIRGLKDKNFTIMEQISGFQGHDLLGYLPAPGQLSLWLIQAILHGAENIVFFRYRTARFGQEQLCYGILDHNKSITSRYIELKKTIQEIKEIAIDIHSIEQTANIAFIHDIDNVRNLKHQPISEGLKFTPAPFANVGYDIEFFSWFAALNTLNVSAHVVPSNFENLERYKVLVLPIYFMYEEKLVERLEKFVSNGGTLILGYRSGIKDKRGWMVDDVVPGPFKFLAGLEVKEFESIGLGEVKIRKGIFSLTGSKISEILEPTTAKVLAKYSDSKKFYKGKAAITVNQYLKGNVYYIGTSLKPDSLAKFFMYILRKEKISFQFWGKDVEIIDRKGKSADYKIILNHSLKTKFYRFHKLAPFSYKIIKKLKG